MKVLRITTRLNFGGVERNFELHAKYHRKPDYELVMVSLEEGGRAEKFIRDCGIRVEILGTRSRIFSWQTMTRLMRLIRKERPDVIHGACAEGIFYGLLAGWLTGVPTRIGEEIGIPSRKGLARFVFSALNRTAYKIYGISKAVSAFLAKYEAPPEKVETIYYPIDSEAILPARTRTAGPYVIATVCRLEEVKNLPVLLDLLSTLKAKFPQKPFELWFLGDGSQRALLEQRTRELHLEKSVVFYGYLEKPLDVLINADLFVLPSHKEGFGLACIEAIQCNIPVVVSRSGGMVEYIEDSVNGFLFDPASFDQLLQKVEVVLQMEPTALVELKKRAQETIHHMFAPARYLDSLNKLYRRQPLNDKA